MMPVWAILLIIFGALIIIIFLCSIRIVPQAHEYVVEFLGKYKRTLSAGAHMLVPFCEKVSKKITLMEQILDAPPQPVITKDNVTMQIDSVVYYRVFDSKLYAYGAVNPVSALENLTATTLRNIVGELDLDGTLTSRDVINAKMTSIIDKGTDDGLAVDMNVIAGGGLVGRITKIGPNWARVTSIISDGVNVSGQVASSDLTLMVTGDLKLIDRGLVSFSLLSDPDGLVVKGDKVVTSNISDKYLPGLLIGYIDTVQNDANNLTKSGTISVATDFDHLSVVLVITDLKDYDYE